MAVKDLNDSCGHHHADVAKLIRPPEMGSDAPNDRQVQE